MCASIKQGLQQNFYGTKSIIITMNGVVVLFMAQQKALVLHVFTVMRDE